MHTGTGFDNGQIHTGTGSALVPTKLQLKKDDFLSNKDNKQRFLGLLGEHLAMCGSEIAYATGDADVPIVQAEVTVSDTCEAVLVGNDTDLLVLLIHLADGNMHTIYFPHEPKKGGAPRCIGVSSIRNKLGENICGNILFYTPSWGVILHPVYSGSGKQLH